MIGGMAQGTSGWCGCLRKSDMGAMKQIKNPFGRCLGMWWEIVEKEIENYCDAVSTLRW